MSPQSFQFNIRPARFPEDAELVRRMFRDYQADIQVDLCFQSFEEELRGLPGKYELVLLAEGGCVALRPYAEGTVELKRLFVYPAARGKGLGGALLQQALDWARTHGYERVRLDTIREKMPDAIRMYKALGFRELPPTGEGTALPGLVDMELVLTLDPDSGDSNNRTESR